jgi:hypothetical protein
MLQQNVLLELLAKVHSLYEQCVKYWPLCRVYLLHTKFRELNVLLPFIAKLMSTVEDEIGSFHLRSTIALSELYLTSGISSQIFPFVSIWRVYWYWMSTSDLKYSLICGGVIGQGTTSEFLNIKLQLLKFIVPRGGVRHMYYGNYKRQVPSTLWHICSRQKLRSQQRKSLLGNGSTNMPVDKQKICKRNIWVTGKQCSLRRLYDSYVTQQENCWERSFLCGPCRSYITKSNCDYERAEEATALKPLLGYNRWWCSRLRRLKTCCTSANAALICSCVL